MQRSGKVAQVSLTHSLRVSPFERSLRRNRRYFGASKGRKVAPPKRENRSDGASWPVQCPSKIHHWSHPTNHFTSRTAEPNLHQIMQHQAHCDRGSCVCVRNMQGNDQLLTKLHAMMVGRACRVPTRQSRGCATPGQTSMPVRSSYRLQREHPIDQIQPT